MKLRKNKKVCFRIIITLICGLSIMSCGKEEEIILKNTDTYSLDLKVAGDEEGASIKAQAKHYERSEIIKDAKVVYYYKPITDFVGTDCVVIETHSNKTGVGTSATKTVRLNFTITK